MFGAVSERAALLCGVRFAPRFDPDNSKQGVEESNPNLEIYAPKNFLNHKVFSSTLAF